MPLNKETNLCELFNAKVILVEKQWYYLTHNWRDQGVHTFLLGISLKVNIIARLQFEVAYFDDAVKHVSHYTMRTYH